MACLFPSLIIFFLVVLRFFLFSTSCLNRARWRARSNDYGVVMLMMEQHQSTSTRPAAQQITLYTAEHRIHTTRRRREPAKQKHREQNLEEEKGAEPGKKDKCHDESL